MEREMTMINVKIASDALCNMTWRQQLEVFIQLTPEQHKEVLNDLLEISEQAARVWGYYVSYPHEPQQTLERIRKHHNENGGK